MTENLLHYIWKYHCFSPHKLKTQSGNDLRIIKIGSHNHDAGPDFEQAQLMIEQTKWIGHIEIHLKSSDWNKHKHQEDAAYSNVILHLVWEDDVEIRNFLGETIPTLQLKNIVDAKLLNRYELFMASKAWIACEKLIAQTPKINLHLFFDRLLIERLEQKTAKIEWMLQQNHNDWEEVFYQFLCKSLGLKINAEPMMQLAQLLPQKVLAKHHYDIIQLEALLFGVVDF